MTRGARSSRLAHALVGVAFAILAACRPSGAPAVPAPAEPALDTVHFAPVLEVDLPRFTRTRSGAYYRDVFAGSGAIASTERTVTVKYVVSLPTGTVVETQNDPLPMVIGPDLLRGLREAIPGMRAGGTRRIVVPPALAYGKVAHGAIPPQSILVFDLRLVDVR